LYSGEKRLGFGTLKRNVIGNSGNVNSDSRDLRPALHRPRLSTLPAITEYEGDYREEQRDTRQ